MQGMQPLRLLEPHPNRPGQLHAHPARARRRLLDGDGLGLLELLLAVPVGCFRDHEGLVVLV